MRPLHSTTVQPSLTFYHCRNIMLFESHYNTVSAAISLHIGARNSPSIPQARFSAQLCGKVSGCLFASCMCFLTHIPLVSSCRFSRKGDGGTVRSALSSIQYDVDLLKMVL